MPIRTRANTLNVIACLAIYSFLTLIPTSAFAQKPMPSSQFQPSVAQEKERTWSGEITTAMCKSTQGSMGHDCILNCVKAGEKYVLITKGQVQEIGNQDFSDLEKHAGHRVRLTGHLGPDGKTITVTTIEMAGSPK